jgi:RNA polymerase sigma factor (TIGR02999 family)
MVYGELHRVARRYMERESDSHTLQSTALVNEAFLKLIKHPEVEWHDREHFFAVGSQIIRRILVDHARKRHASKRGSGAAHALADDSIADGVPADGELIALDDALERLAKLDPVQSKVVELRFFGGLSVDETATALGLARRTIGRKWATARLWLQREMTAQAARGPSPPQTRR